MEQRHRCKGISLLAIVLVTLLMPTQATSENTMFYVETMHIEDAQAQERKQLSWTPMAIFTLVLETHYTNLMRWAISCRNRHFLQRFLPPLSHLIPHDWPSPYEEVQLAKIQHSSFRVEILALWFSSSATSSNAHLLDWSDNGASIFTNGPEQGLIQLSRDALEIDKTYSGNHTDFPCLF